MIESDFIVVVLDDLALRTHETLPAAADIMFLYATASIDCQDSKLFRIIVPSPAEESR